MRVYYLSNGKILKVTRDIDPLPEDSPKTSINIPFSILEVDEGYNRVLCFKLIRNERFAPEGEPLPDRFSIDVLGRLIDNDTQEIITINPNPHKELYKLSVFAGVTPQQIDNYIDNNITSLATAKEFLKKLTRVVQLVLREVRFED